MSRHVVAAVDDIPPGGRKLFSIKGRPIAVFNLDGRFYGLLNRCPHQGGSLCEGVTTGLLEADRPGDYRYGRVGEILRCPWHGWEFDIRTGLSTCDPEKVRTRAYPVSTLDGAEAGQLAAETVPVSVSQRYVIVEV
jgi:3-phenylpropionate/trans-cinnamate dioxygenase ferredoxin subunit